MIMPNSKEKPIGVTVGWSLKPQLVFLDGTIFYSPKCDRVFYPEYFSMGEWPTDPHTKERLLLLSEEKKRCIE